MTDTEIASVRGTEIDAGEPWARIDLSVDDYAEEARAALATQEAEAHAQIREIFAGMEARLELDLVRMVADVAAQRGEVH